ncbi:MAG: hypothetical protein ACOC0G_01215 [Thermodesulfobacteriota bacterium]
MRCYLNIWIILLLFLSACAPVAPKLDLSPYCRADTPQQELIQNHWLNQENTWRLRQSALLEIGTRKNALEGFVRLDLKQRQVRLVALNEMGLVVFDLHVDPHSEKLMRALPQVRKIKGFATGVGASLRHIFLTPRPRADDTLEDHGHYQRLVRREMQEHGEKSGRLEFVFDCAGNLRRTRLQSATSTWQVLYSAYREYALKAGHVEIPESIVLHNAQQRMKLTLTLNDVRQE